MGRSRKLERALWTGLAVTAFAAGIAGGPTIKDTSGKFGKWFEKTKTESIEHVVEKAREVKPKLKPPEKTEKSSEKEEVSVPDEEEIEILEKKNKEYAGEVPEYYRYEVKTTLTYLDSKEADDEAKENCIEAYLFVIENLNDYDSDEQMNILHKMLRTLEPEEIELELAKSYVKLCENINEAVIKKYDGDSKLCSFFGIGRLKILADKGKLNYITMEEMRFVMELSEDKSYAYDSVRRFITANDQFQTDQLNAEFVNNFAAALNKIERDRVDYYELHMLAFIFGVSLLNPELGMSSIDEDYVERIEDMLFYIHNNTKNSEREVVINAYKHIVRGPGSGVSPSHVEAGGEIAESLGFYDFESAFNFGYALNTIGEDKIMELYEEYNITYFARYDKEILEELCNAMDPEYKKDRPVALAVYNKNDWNGAFYQDRKKHGGLKNTYKVIVYEVENEYEFRNAIRETYKKHGKIDVFSINGHGEPEEINMGEGNGEYYSIDMGDRVEMEHMKYMFVENPKIILNSCSTGKKIDGIGAMLSDVFDATLWAPERPSGGIGQTYNFDEEGILRSIDYVDSNCKKFVDGEVEYIDKATLEKYQ